MMPSERADDGKHDYEVIVTHLLEVVHHVRAKSEREANYLVLTRLQYADVKTTLDKPRVRRCSND